MLEGITASWRRVNPEVVQTTDFAAKALRGELGKFVRASKRRSAVDCAWDEETGRQIG
jgi:hypothetical protein